MREWLSYFLIRWEWWISPFRVISINPCIWKWTQLECFKMVSVPASITSHRKSSFSLISKSSLFFFLSSFFLSPPPIIWFSMLAKLTHLLLTYMWTCCLIHFTISALLTAILGAFRAILKTKAVNMTFSDRPVKTIVSNLWESVKYLIFKKFKNTVIFAF